jgi:DNA polymerase III gamma/tau subunit
VQIGPDGQPAPVPAQPDPGVQVIYDITAGKYDLTVSSGPSYTTRREEMQDAITSIIQSAPQTAPILVPVLVKNMDFPDSEEISQKLEALDPTAQQAVQQQMQQAVGQVQQQAQETIGQAQQQLQQMQQTVAQLQTALKDKAGEQALKARELEIKSFEAETARMSAAHSLMQPTRAPSVNS